MCLRYMCMDIDLFFSFLVVFFSFLVLVTPLLLFVVVALLGIYIYKRIRKDFN